MNVSRSWTPDAFQFHHHHHHNFAADARILLRLFAFLYYSPLYTYLNKKTVDCIMNKLVESNLCQDADPVIARLLCSADYYWRSLYNHSGIWLILPFSHSILAIFSFILNVLGHYNGSVQWLFSFENGLRNLDGISINFRWNLHSDEYQSIASSPIQTVRSKYIFSFVNL